MQHEMLSVSLDRLPPHASVGLFAPRRTEAVAGAAAFLRVGIARGEKCLLLCSRRFSEEIFAALRALGSDVAAALARGALVVDRETQAKGDGAGTLISALGSARRLASAERRSALRVLVEAPHAVDVDGDWHSLLACVKRLAPFLASSASPSLFVYPEDALPGETLPRLLRCHPWFLRDGKLAENLYHVVQVEGEESPPDATSRFRQRVRHLLDRHDQVARVERQAIRLSRLRDLSLSLLSRADANDLYRGVVEAILALGHVMCWVGMARPDGSVEPVVASTDLGYLREITVRWDDTPEGRGPVGTAIRHNRPDVIADIERSRRFAPWRESASSRGFRSVAAFPVAEGERAVGALVVYSTRKGAFDAEVVEELSSFALMASLVLQRTREYASLAESGERIRRFFEQIPAACFTFDPEGVVTEWNLHCRRLFGLSAKEAVGRDAGKILFREGDVAEARRVLTRVFAGESFYNLEWEARPPGRERRFVLANVVPFRDREGRVELGSCVAVDVTERVEAQRALGESEGKFRSLVENAGVCVVETGRDGKVRLFNTAAERITGYPRDEVLGKDFLSLVPERERPGTAARRREVLAGKESEGALGVVTTRDGSERTLSWHSRPLLDPSGAVSGVLSIGIDVHEKLLLDRERDEVRRRLEQTRRMEALASLANGIAGEFNSTLGAVLGYATLIESRAGDDEEVASAAARIREAAERAAELTGKLAGFARPDRAEKAPFFLDDVASRVAEILSLEGDRRMTVRCTLSPAPVGVEGDEARVERALLALCVNGRDAMPDGGTLTISVGSSEVGEEEGDRLQLRWPGRFGWVEVADTGRGMTREEAERVFDPLYTTKGSGGGSGMGLSIVYRTAHDHGGAVRVESEPGRGSRFRLYLPTVAERRPPAPAPAPVPRGTGAILVADDEAEMRRMAGALLASLGYTPLLASDGEEAVRIFREKGGEVRLVLLDLVMPRMDGREAMAEIRAIDPRVPVLLSSGYPGEEERGGAPAARPPFLKKPYGLAELARAVKDALEGKGA